MVQISIPKEFERARKFVAIPVREYTAFLKTRRVRRVANEEARVLLQDSLDLQAALRNSSGEFVDAREFFDEAEQSRRVFTKRPLAAVQQELSKAHPDDPQLVADVIAGLKRSSLYAKRLAAAR